MSIEEATIHVGDTTAEWCPSCWRTTLNAASVYALTSTGPLRIGEWAICERCGYSPHSDRERGHRTI